jgi:hypothetical protein
LTTCKFLCGVALASAFTLVAACHAETPSRNSSADLIAIDVSAVQSLDSASFNKQLMAAHAEGQEWASDPVQIVSKLLIPEVARSAIWMINGAGERPNSYQITIVSDGIPDDSLRGKRYDLTIARTQDGRWQIINVVLSWRCWRGRNDVFDVKPCP